jgi:hypothetical protein
VNIDAYPGAIAAATRAALEIAANLAIAELDLSKVEGRIDFEIAFSPDLKNELQRKATRTQMAFEDGEFVELAKTVATLDQQRLLALLHRDQLKDEFRVAKLAAERENATLAGAR